LVELPFSIGGQPRLTRDVDVTVLVTPKDFDAFLEKAVRAFKPESPMPCYVDKLGFMSYN